MAVRHEMLAVFTEGEAGGNRVPVELEADTCTDQQMRELAEETGWESAFLSSSVVSTGRALGPVCLLNCTPNCRRLLYPTGSGSSSLAGGNAVLAFSMNVWCSVMTVRAARMVSRLTPCSMRHSAG
jgi:hypothetical protein